MASLNSKPAPKTRRTKFYREFLTPALHRRFTRAAGVLLLVSYVEAVFIRDKTSYFWLWFPVGPAGMCTLLLFMSALVIFVLRVANLHFGERHTISPASSFLQCVLGWTALQTFAFYLFSAWLFSEIYVFSGPSYLRWVNEGKTYERPSLNEWPIYLRSHFLALAVFQAAAHIFHDNDRVVISPLPGAANAETGYPPEFGGSAQLRAVLPTIAWEATKQAFFATIIDPFFYMAFLRSSAWNWSLSFARVFWSVSANAEPPRLPPFHLRILVRSWSAGAMLLFLWKLSNAAFSIYAASRPLKKGKALTNDSKDPNGTLLTGLKSKKEAVREFAFWELHWISFCDEVRRKSIYCEIDRSGGSTWTQTLKASLGVVQDIAVRITSNNDINVEGNPLKEVHVEKLPRLSAPLKEGQILRARPSATNRTEAVEDTVGSFAKSIGESPDSSPLYYILVHFGAVFLSEETRKALGWDSIVRVSKDIGIRALGSHVAAAFRETFARRVSMTVLGSPRGDLRPILLSINSVAQLAIEGVQEDTYGTVSKDVALILRTFANTVDRIDKFVRECPVPWSDVGFREEGGREVEEVELVLFHLRMALRKLLEGYGQFAMDMGLSPSEVREARKAAGLPPAAAR